jgi:hypothetical protein
MSEESDSCGQTELRMSPKTAVVQRSSDMLKARIWFGGGMSLKRASKDMFWYVVIGLLVPVALPQRVHQMAQAVGKSVVAIPAYVRGMAYLASHQGSEAASEFQKILDHRGLVANSQIAALARLQIGRAYAIQGDISKAKAAYHEFLTLWKDADPDIPVLIAGKSEYAKLM